MSLLLPACTGGQSQVPATTGDGGATVTVQGEALAVPENVDPALMESLAGELERVLSARGKEPAAPVQGVMVDPLGRTDSGDDAVLAWRYNNGGDYNLDGLVGVSDLTPIGIHYNKSSTAPDWAAASCADGTDDGLISVTDITPIGQNYGNFVTNYVVEADIEGNGTWVPVANVARDTGGPGTASDWLEFEAPITNGCQCAEFRVYAGAEVPAGDLHELTVDPNAFRVDIYPWVIAGMAPLQVTFDVEFTNATAPINVDLDYGDGSAIDQDYSPFGDPLQFDHTFAAAGDYTVMITADDAADHDTATVAIHVDEATGEAILNPGYWEEYRLTVGEGSGLHCAAALIDNKPWLIYTDDDKNSVEFARALVEVPADTSDWVTETIDGGPTNHMGGTIDIVGCYGVACVVYEATTDDDMWFASSTSLEPWDESDWTKHEPDWDMSQGKAQLAVVNDRIAMTYVGGSGTDEDMVTWNPGVRYARGYVLDPTPPNDEILVPPSARQHWIKTEVDGVSGQYMDYLQIDTAGGLPILAYQRAESGFKEVRYAYADSLTPDLTANWTTMKVDDLNKNSGLRIQLAVTPAGLPVLAYQNVDINEFIRWAIADSATPANPGSWVTRTVYQVSQEDLGRDLSLAWYDGRPVMSWTWHTDNSNLYASYPTRDNPVDETQWQHAPLETASTYFISGSSSFLYLADGRLAVFYRTSDGLTFSYFTPPV